MAKSVNKQTRSKSIAAKHAANTSLEGAQVTNDTIETVTTSKVTGNDIPVRPTHIFVDRSAGTPAWECIFGDAMSLDLMIRTFREDDKTPARIGNFYRTLAVEGVLLSLMGTGFTRPSDIQFGVLDLKDALVSKGGLTSADALIVADQLVPILRRAGFRVNVNERFMTMTKAPRRFVTLNDLRNDAAAQFAASVIDKSRISSLTDARYMPAVLANDIAVDLRSIGTRLLAIPSFARVFDDLVIAVRAHLDRANAAYYGIPDWLREHTVVEEFARNMTFITAAFDTKAPATPALQMGETDLQANLAELAATLKASKRYANMSLKALAAEYSITHGDNYDGETAFAVIANNVAYAPGIMTTMPVIDKTEIRYLDPYVTHVGEVLASHDLGIFKAEEVTKAVVNNMCVRAGDARTWPSGTPPMVTVMTVYDEYLDPQTLLALVHSNQVFLRSEVTTGANPAYMIEKTVAGKTVETPHLVFSVTAAPNRRLPTALRNQMLDSRAFVTEDANLVMLMIPSLDSTSARTPIDQLPPATVFGAHLINVPASMVQKANDGVKYDFTVGNTNLAGEFFIKQLDAVRTISAQAFVVNSANVLLAKSLMQSLIWAADEESDIKRKINLNSAIYNAVIDMADRISLPLREEVHAKIITAAVQKVTVDQSVAMRSAYNRSMFAIQVDMYVLELYFKIIGAHEAATILRLILADDGMQLAMSQRGSSRRNRSTC